MTKIDLRQRRRLQTREEIHKAAIKLVLKRGMNEVTVEEIAEEAGVSPRTFFNYFATKADAVLPGPPPLSDEARERFIASDNDLLTDLRELIDDYTHLSLESRSEVVQLRPLLHAQPELWRMMHRRFGEFEHDIATAIAQRKNREEPSNNDHTRAAVVTAMLRAAVRGWLLSTSDEPLEAVLEESFATVRRMISEP